MVVIAAHSLPPARLTGALVLQAGVLLRLLLPPPALTLSASVGGQGPHSVWGRGGGGSDATATRIKIIYIFLYIFKVI